MKSLLRWTMLPLLLACSGCQLVKQQDTSADRAAIHALLVDYGATLDARDFDGFAALFARDGVYVAGSGEGASGAAAGAMMKQVFAENALGFPEPNYHLFFNEVITLDGPDKARATSMSVYMVPGDAGRPAPAMMARYTDELVREDGTWKFARREVKSLIPAPAAAD
jgi:uncharacterized protein (TIGR02246 family)